jgi:hypothetical protein
MTDDRVVLRSSWGATGSVVVGGRPNPVTSAGA